MHNTGAEHEQNRLNVLEAPQPICLQCSKKKTHLPPNPISLPQSRTYSPPAYKTATSSLNPASRRHSASKSSASSPLHLILSARLLRLLMASANAISTASLVRPLSQVWSSCVPWRAAFLLSRCDSQLFLGSSIAVSRAARPFALRFLAQFVELWTVVS